MRKGVRICGSCPTYIAGGGNFSGPLNAKSYVSQVSCSAAKQPAGYAPTRSLNPSSSNVKYSGKPLNSIGAYENFRSIPANWKPPKVCTEHLPPPPPAPSSPPKRKKEELKLTPSNSDERESKRLKTKREDFEKWSEANPIPLTPQQKAAETRKRNREEKERLERLNPPLPEKAEPFFVPDKQTGGVKKINHHQQRRQELKRQIDEDVDMINSTATATASATIETPRQTKKQNQKTQRQKKKRTTARGSDDPLLLLEASMEIDS